MFVGHYAVSFALKAVDKRVPLAVLFVAVQLLDIIFFPLTLIGIERFNLIENYTQSTHFELLHMPYSHSLLAVTLWSLLSFFIIKLLIRLKKKNSSKIALIVTIAVMSHWWLDFIVHTPDLPILPTSSAKYGLGLWQNAMITYVLEAILLIAGFCLYMKSTKKLGIQKTFVAKFGMLIFVLLLLMVNVLNIFGPLSPDETKESVATSGVIAYFIFAGIVYLLEKKRID